MIQFTIALADRHISISALHETTRDFCRGYLADKDPDFSLVISQADIDYEREKSEREDALEGIPVRSFTDEYLETLAVYRKIADKMLSFDTLLFHGSAIAVDGAAYLFTAKSGTGKSTHTRLWRETFGDRAYMVNDDKPLLKITDNGVWVCGTPWDGKHRLSKNTIVPQKGICILERGAENTIRCISVQEALPMIFQQSHRPLDPLDLTALLSLVDKLTRQVNIYKLACNMHPDAVTVAYNGMQ